MVDLACLSERIKMLRAKASRAHEVDCIWFAFWSPVIGGVFLKSAGYQDVSPWIYLGLTIFGAYVGHQSGKSRGMELNAEAEALLAQKTLYEAVVRIEARLNAAP